MYEAISRFCRSACEAPAHCCRQFGDEKANALLKSPQSAAPPCKIGVSTRAGAALSAMQHTVLQ